MPQPGHAMLTRWTPAFRLAGHAGLLLIIILSLVPGSARPHTGAGGGIEHWVAYLLVGACYGLGLARRNPAVVAGLALALTAAILEVLQLFVPGRNAEFSGFASSAFGACTGLLAGFWVMRGLGRAAGRSG